MNKFKLKLAVAVATSTVVMLGGATASNASELTLAPNQPSQSGQIGLGTDGMYLVRLADPAIATYNGSIQGLSATSAKSTGKKRLDTKSSAAKKYKKHLDRRQAEVLSEARVKLGRALKTAYRYHYATNGFAAIMTADEAKALSKIDGVQSVQRERMEHINTDSGPAWIGAPSIWNNKKGGSQGEGVVVAVLDTGINSDHPSFADVGADGYDHDNPLGSGNYIPGSYCVANPGFCNDKLIGAWDFDTVDGPNPEDEDGHGSHTASTVAGNFVDNAEIFAPTATASFNISGVAPHANIIAYDVCHWTPSGGSCPGAATAAAIDQVLIDAGNLPNGIAALNYSISGGGDPWNDYVEMGFLAAVDAGVYVAASAGNSGPAASTVAHLGPWVSTTAASTHDRQIVNSVIDITSDDGTTADISGLGLTSGYGPAPIINSADLEGTYPGSTLCGSGVIGDYIAPWPPGTFNGEIIVCTRGTYGRTEKGTNALSAGAGGMILMDNGSGLVADGHDLPAVHISQADGVTLSAWLAANSGSNPMGSISGFSIENDPAAGDVMGGFSSRGPQLAFDVLKPDLTAPGVNIMGADSDVFGQYQIISGTSMSSPHNAGAGALMAATNPDLTAQEIKSAIMLTASNEFMVKEDGTTPTDPFDDGAGRIDLYSAKNGGLVLSESTANFEAANPALGGDPSTLNLASMMNSNCVGSCSWTRTVSNKEKSTSHWNVTASVAGVNTDLEVNPAAKSKANNLKLKKGQSADITVTVDTTTADEGWHFGSVALDRNTGNAPDLSMPIAVYASRASNAGLFTKSVDTATASSGDTLTYELSVTNGQVAGPITVTDELPEGTTFVSGSETEVVNMGSTSSTWAYDAGTNSMSWTGELVQGALELVAAPGGSIQAAFGLPAFYPLANFGVAPLTGTCNGSCDEGGFYFTGLPAFNYNGETHSAILLSVNGTLEAGDASLSFSSYINESLPNSDAPNNILAPFWGDLDMSNAGSMSLGVLNACGGSFTVYEWNDVPFWGSADTVSMQIWIGNNDSCLPGVISFGYGEMNINGVFGTVGVEDSTGTIGSNYYFDGAGTAPALGAELLVQKLPGGSATLGFQVEADCDTEAVVNRGELSSSAGDEAAIAVTQCQ